MPSRQCLLCTKTFLPGKFQQLSNSNLKTGPLFGASSKEMHQTSSSFSVKYTLSTQRKHLRLRLLLGPIYSAPLEGTMHSSKSMLHLQRSF